MVSMEDILISFLPNIYVGIAMVAVVLIINHFNKDKFERQKEKEFKENLAFDAKGEPHVLRSLTELERNILIKEHKEVYQVSKIMHFIIPLFVVAVFTIAYFVYKYWSMSNMGGDFLGIIFIPFPALIFLNVFSYYYYKHLRKNDLDKDLRSPVFAVKGELLKGKVRQRNRILNNPLYTFFIRGVEFNNKENTQIDKYWSDWGEGAIVFVEYSPFTKHIWKIEKV